MTYREALRQAAIQIGEPPEKAQFFFNIANANITCPISLDNTIVPGDEDEIIDAVARLWTKIQKLIDDGITVDDLMKLLKNN